MIPTGSAARVQTKEPDREFVTVMSKRRCTYNSRRGKTVSRVGNHPVITENILRNIYISECLAPQIQQLLLVCRQLKRERAAAVICPQDGRVKIRV